MQFMPLLRAHANLSAIGIGVSQLSDNLLQHVHKLMYSLIYVSFFLVEKLNICIL